MDPEKNGTNQPIRAVPLSPSHSLSFSLSLSLSRSLLLSLSLSLSVSLSLALPRSEARTQLQLYIPTIVWLIIFTKKKRKDEKKKKKGAMAGRGNPSCVSASVACWRSRVRWRSGALGRVGGLACWRWGASVRGPPCSVVPVAPGRKGARELLERPVSSDAGAPVTEGIVPEMR